jgi:Sporulation and spore germination
MPKASNGTGPAVFMLVLIGAMGAGVLAYYVQSNPSAQRVPAAIRKPEVEVHASTHVTKPPTASVEVEAKPVDVVRVPKLDGGNVSLVAPETAPAEGEDPKTFVASHVLTAAGLTNVRCLGVQVKESVALVEFSKELTDGVGSMEEGDFVKMLEVGFGQFSDVKKVQILIDGKPVDTLGHLELTDPLPVSEPGPVASSEAP